MDGMRVFNGIRNATLLTSLSIVLSGCLSDDKADTETDNVRIDNNITGSVGDGPIAAAAMRVLRNDGDVLDEFVSDTFADFDITVTTRSGNYPLTIEARDGIDLVTNRAPDFTLFGVVPAASESTIANVNPFSTFTVVLARDLPGGLSKENVDIAERIVTTWFNSGLTSLDSSGTLATRIDASNIAEIVKASEALSETVRRTRNLVQIFGSSSTANQVIGALASDLIDELVDGRGGVAANARIAAISTVASAQVLLETMSNEIHVNDVDATGAMTIAIEQVLDAAPTSGIGDQTVTAKMLTTVRIGLAAAFAVTDSPKITELQQAVSGIQAGMDHTLVRTLLPDDYRATLEDILMLIAGGDNAAINTINDVARNGGEDPPTNRGPTISGTPSSSVLADSAYSFQPSADDPDGHVLIFSISGQPSWANFDTTTGRLSGTPGSRDVGNYPNIVIGVSDGDLAASLPAFSISVTTSNSAPTIAGNPPSQVNANSQYSFTPTASDPDGNSLTFSISGRPAWATFNTSTGKLSGTPSANDAGSYNNVVISVTDGQATVSLPAFTITVVFTNTAPTISGNPPNQVNANSQYSFTPNASDPDGNDLTFSVSGLPGWARFDTSTGRISGAPSDADVGTYSGIRITVSDGGASATLGPFSITVNAISLGSVTLSWTPPTQNEDGTTLTDLAGYKIYWGTSAGSYPNSVTINNSGIASYVVDNLVPGTYEFVATSFNVAGVESVYSNVAVKVVN